MAKKSFDQRLKDRWLGKETEKEKKMAKIGEFDSFSNNKIFNQLRRIILHSKKKSIVYANKEEVKNDQRH